MPAWGQVADSLLLNPYACDAAKTVIRDFGTVLTLSQMVVKRILKDKRLLRRRKLTLYIVLVYSFNDYIHIVAKTACKYRIGWSCNKRSFLRA